MIPDGYIAAEQDDKDNVFVQDNKLNIEQSAAVDSIVKVSLANIYNWSLCFYKATLYIRMDSYSGLEH